MSLPVLLLKLLAIQWIYNLRLSGTSRNYSKSTVMQFITPDHTEESSHHSGWYCLVCCLSQDRNTLVLCLTDHLLYCHYLSLVQDVLLLVSQDLMRFLVDLHICVLLPLLLPPCLRHFNTSLLDLLQRMQNWAVGLCVIMFLNNISNFCGFHRNFN